MNPLVMPIRPPLDMEDLVLLMALNDYLKAMGEERSA